MGNFFPLSGCVAYEPEKTPDTVLTSESLSLSDFFETSLIYSLIANLLSAVDKSEISSYSGATVKKETPKIVSGLVVKTSIDLFEFST